MDNSLKWQRVRFMPNIPLGKDRQYVTGSQEHIDLSRQAAQEGMVLLKNESGILPLLRGQKIAVFGIGQIDYAKGGGGSGFTYTAYSRNIAQGLEIKEKEGKVRLYHPLTFFYREEAAKQLETAQTLGKEIYQGMLSEPEIPKDMIREAAAFTDHALLVYSRFSKEGYDRTGDPYDGDFYLSKEEEQLLQEVRKSFRHIIVLLNTGGIMDVSWFQNDPCIEGALLLWQAGMEGGLAVADILTGDVNPSGHLCDTFAASFNAYPYASHFSDSPDYVEYTEDVFVGYRYFETFPEAKAQVCYPFGYGLSYTAFEISPKDFSETEQEYVVDISVRNTGDRSGKEVVQLYAESPEGILGGPARILIGFRKTRLLEPKEEERLQIRFNKYQLSRYDDLGKVQKSAYLLEKGTYHFFVGENVRDAVIVAGSLQIEETELVEQLSERCKPRRLRERLTYSGETELLPTDEAAPLPAYEPELCPGEEETPDEVPWKEVKRWKLLSEDRPVQLIDVYEGRIGLDQFLSKLSLEQKISLLGGQPNRGVANTFGFGNIPYFGVPNIMTADGPAGLRIQPEAGVNTTAFPCETLLACTFNEELMSKIGEAVAMEAKENGIGIWLAPAVNIHRNPLCGRNFEYLSEDPLLAGKMAAALVRGLQKQGVSASVKHFACNNKETNRKESDSRVSERALREIYLKAFEICVKEGQCWSIMSAYNLLNGVRCSENRDLLTGILREEWGFTGVTESDWVTHGLHEKEVLAGNNIKMPCGRPNDLLQRVLAGSLSEKELEDAAGNVLKLILKIY